MKLTSSKLVGFQLSAFLLLCGQSPAADLDIAKLPDVVLLDFASSYCGPCKQMVPLLQNMEKADFPVRTIDTTENPALTQKFNVQLLPTLVIMVEGKEVKRFQGFTDENTLRAAMNQAARKLHADRQRVRQKENPRFARATESSDARSGLSGFFDRFKSPNRSNPSEDSSDVRAQSPDESPGASERNSLPHRATVRIRLQDGKMRDVGTGTVIHSVKGQSTILTCAHIFKDAAANATVEVDVFVDGKVFKYPATILGGDHNADVALIRIKNSAPLPTAEIGFNRTMLQEHEDLFSIGCSNGDPPTRLKMKVVGVNKVIGPSNVLCTNAPEQGRSGGGLFDKQNRLVGVCSAADYKGGEGLYGGLPPIQDLMEDLKLTALIEKTVRNPHSTSTVSRSSTVSENTASSSSPSSTTGSSSGSASGSGIKKSADAGDTSPFPTDDDVFEELFGNPGGASPDTANLAPTNQPIQTALADPFQSSGSAVSSIGAGSSATEVTVIIKDESAPNGQRVVVIPKASPWLLKLLTGENSPGQSASSGLGRSRMQNPSAAHRSLERQLPAGRPTGPAPGSGHAIGFSDFEGSAPFFQ